MEHSGKQGDTFPAHEKPRRKSQRENQYILLCENANLCMPKAINKSQRTIWGCIIYTRRCIFLPFKIVKKKISTQNEKILSSPMNT